ncbi:MAG: NADH-quinone oxidoreductase subunit H [Candidatus Omnitrophica bacterium]|nr:NADH-quinone oxidoreductase subunit H [Candidatus Omnitrophota bacterium]MDD5488898.1 NADH-quinone oxidoreductase subunit H [Candidatus Omnitrophota bacterium]
MYMRMAHYIFVIALSPLLFGIINRTKAFFAGRKGSPLLQLYHDIFKLLRKGAVYSKTTTWVFIAGPIVSLSAILAALTLVPFAGYPALVSFDGDLVLFIYLLALARFFMVIAALDTGSSFEGMGASREVQFAVFAEPALFLALAALARITGQVSISGIFSNTLSYSWTTYGPLIFLIWGAVFIVFLSENSRIPVDDPNTHLELTMIHEAMVLDHSGPDLACIFYGAALKFWVLGTLLAGMFFGADSHTWAVDRVIYILWMLLLAVIVGVVESVLARLRLLKVPHLLIIALALSAVSLILTLRQ